MFRPAWLLALVVASLARAADLDPPVPSAPRLEPGDPAWRDLLVQFAQRPDAAADFEERRSFSFKKTPAILRGEVRVSATRGLSLHYTEPQERIVIIDDRGLLLREAARDTTPPSDPRATAANNAMLHVLRLDLRALAEIFELYGQRLGAAWTLALVPRDVALRRTLGQITVTGENATVQRIELRRSLTQRVEILVGPPRTPAVAFTSDDVRHFFR